MIFRLIQSEPFKLSISSFSFFTFLVKFFRFNGLTIKVRNKFSLWVKQNRGVRVVGVTQTVPVQLLITNRLYKCSIVTLEFCNGFNVHLIIHNIFNRSSWWASWSKQNAKHRFIKFFQWPISKQPPCSCWLCHGLLVDTWIYAVWRCWRWTGVDYFFL